MKNNHPYAWQQDKFNQILTLQLLFNKPHQTNYVTHLYYYLHLEYAFKSKNH